MPWGSFMPSGSPSSVSANAAIANASSDTPTTSVSDTANPAAAGTQAPEEALKGKFSRKRTKTGCLTCRKRRIKCGEERPICKNCVRSKRHCEGYNQRVVFKSPISDYRSAPDEGLHFSRPGASPIPWQPQQHEVHLALEPPISSSKSPENACQVSFQEPDLPYRGGMSAFSSPLLRDRSSFGQPSFLDEDVYCADSTLKFASNSGPLFAPANDTIAASEVSSAAADQAEPRKHHFSNRVKTGCLTCRARKKKCDEAKPTCKNCRRGAFECGYGAKPTRYLKGSSTSSGNLQANTSALIHSHFDGRATGAPSTQWRCPFVSLACGVYCESEGAWRSHLLGHYDDPRLPIDIVTKSKVVRCPFERTGCDAWRFSAEDKDGWGLLQVHILLRHREDVVIPSEPDAQNAGKTETTTPPPENSTNSQKPRSLYLDAGHHLVNSPTVNRTHGTLTPAGSLGREKSYPTKTASEEQSSRHNDRASTSSDEDAFEASKYDQPPHGGSRNARHSPRSGRPIIRMPEPQDPNSEDTDEGDRTIPRWSPSTRDSDTPMHAQETRQFPGALELQSMVQDLHKRVDALLQRTRSIRPIASCNTNSRDRRSHSAPPGRTPERIIKFDGASEGASPSMTTALGDDHRGGLSERSPSSGRASSILSADSQVSPRARRWQSEPPIGVTQNLPHVYVLGSGSAGGASTCGIAPGAGNFGTGMSPEGQFHAKRRPPSNNQDREGDDEDNLPRKHRRLQNPDDGELETDRLPCIYYVGEPRRYRTHVKKYNHISQLLRHLKSHGFYACSKCFTRFPDLQDLAEHDRSPCVKSCRSRRCRRFVAPMDSRSNLCACVTTPEEQWQELYRLEYPNSNANYFRPEGQEILAFSSQTGVETWQVPADTAFPSFQAQEGPAMASVEHLDFDLDLASQALTSHPRNHSREPLRIDNTFADEVQTLRERVQLLEQRLAQPTEREQDLDMVLGNVWQALVRSGSADAQPESPVWRLVRRFARNILSTTPAIAHRPGTEPSLSNEIAMDPTDWQKLFESVETPTQAYTESGYGTLR